MNQEVGSPEEILDEWVLNNIFVGTKYDQFDAEDIALGAELDGAVPPGMNITSVLQMLGASAYRISMEKNSDLEKYPYIEV